MEENNGIISNSMDGKTPPAPGLHFGRKEAERIRNSGTPYNSLSDLEIFTLDNGHRYPTEDALEAGWARISKAREKVLLTKEEFLAEADAKAEEMETATEAYRVLLELASLGILNEYDVYQYAHYRWCIQFPQAIVSYYSEIFDIWLVNNCDTEISAEAAVMYICREFGFEASHIKIVGTPYYFSTDSCFIRFDCRYISWLAKDGEIFQLQKTGEEKHMEKTFAIEQETLAGRDIPELYDAIAAELVYNISNKAIRYDCRKVCISENIQNMLWEAYEMKNPQAFFIDKERASLEVTRLLQLCGPKVDHSLPDNTVRTQEGFAFYESDK